MVGDLNFWVLIKGKRQRERERKVSKSFIVLAFILNLQSILSWFSVYGIR